MKKSTRIGALILMTGMWLSSANASEGTFEEIKTRAYSDVLVCENSNSPECLERKKPSGVNKNASWRPDVEEDEVYSPNLSGSYDGAPGWQAKYLETDERNNLGKNRNYKQDSKYYENCYPGEPGTNCEINISDSDNSNKNKNYDNDARYYGGGCYSGESDSECRLRLGDRDNSNKNKNYDNDARYYGGGCYVGESDSECKARQGQNTNYRNNAQYYGECNPEEEDCKGNGTNRNYQLNMSDFSGNGSDIYSGIPGGGQNSNLYRDIPIDSSNRNTGQVNKGQSGYDSASGKYSYGSVDSQGAFSGYGGSDADWESIDNKRIEFDQALEQEFNEEGLYKDKEKTNWMMTLVFCHLQIPFEGVHSVYSDKTCRKSIRKLCSFKVSRMKVSGPSQCVGFAPWNM